MTRGTTEAKAGTQSELVREWLVCQGRHSLVVLELARGRYQNALAIALSPEIASSPFESVTYPDLVEAAVRTGARDVAESTVRKFDNAVVDGRSPLAIGLLARSRALLADGDEARNCFEESIGALRQADALCQIARTNLLYGEWLRRHHCRVEARTFLRSALSFFEGQHAFAFVERATRELEATSEHLPCERGGLILTPQESQVAELASQGATNREIARLLYISRHTVDYHLRKVFQKLNVVTRRELCDSLAPRRGADAWASAES